MRIIAIIFSAIFCTNAYSITSQYNKEQLHDKQEADLHNECVRTILRHEYKYQIKKNLLLAIAIVESGRKTGEMQKWPWPWTICAQRKSYFLRSEQEALETLKALKAQGVKNIDVGCMQINIISHKDALKKMQSVFAIEECVRYAAQLLKKLYQNRKQWEKAVAHYHTRTQHLGHAYQQRVFREWNRLNKDPYIEKIHKELQQELNHSASKVTKKIYDAAYTNAYQDAYHNAYEDIWEYVQSDIQQAYQNAYDTAYQKAYAQAYKDIREISQTESAEIDCLHQIAICHTPKV